jgi:hypothetical protein
MEKSTKVIKTIATPELFEENPDLIGQVELGEEIEIERPLEMVIHPILLLNKDNFEFQTPDMDVVFYTMMYKLYMRMVPLVDTIQDNEFKNLLEVYKHFLTAVVNKCVEDGHIEPVEEDKLQDVFKSYEKRMLDAFEQEVKPEFTENE